MKLQRGASEWGRLKFVALRAIIAHHIAAHRGCGTFAAKSLGMQRTYLVRLEREFGLPKGVRGQRCRGFKR